jgi:hypothetical protein
MFVGGHEPTSYCAGPGTASSRLSLVMEEKGQKLAGGAALGFGFEEIVGAR